MNPYVCVLHAFQSKVMERWHEMLDDMDEFAECLNVSLAADQVSYLSWAPSTSTPRFAPQRTSTSEAQPTPRYRSRTPRFHCEHHGANSTHDTLDCLVLRNRAPTTSRRGSGSQRCGVLAASNRSWSPQPDGMSTDVTIPAATMSSLHGGPTVNSAMATMRIITL